MARNKFFLSYRRSDTKQVTGHLFEQLRAYFGRDTIFLDVDGIRAGVDFREVIVKRLSQCAALLIIINPTWTHAFDQRVQENAPDFVLFEIETALEQHVPVIPVLVDGAIMPTASQLPLGIQKLAEIQAIAIADHPLFNETLRQLERQARGYLPPYWRIPQRAAFLLHSAHSSGRPFSSRFHPLSASSRRIVCIAISWIHLSLQDTYSPRWAGHYWFCAFVVPIHVLTFCRSQCGHDRHLE